MRIHLKRCGDWREDMHGTRRSIHRIGDWNAGLEPDCLPKSSIFMFLVMQLASGSVIRELEERKPCLNIYSLCFTTSSTFMIPTFQRPRSVPIHDPDVTLPSTRSPSL
jgi:hypothetical protein